MPEFWFHCPDCEARLAIGGGEAGTRRRCHNCGQDCDVPAWRELELLAGPAPDLAAPGERGGGLSCRPPRWILAVGSLLLLGFAVVSVLMNSLAQSRDRALLNRRREGTRELGQQWLLMQSRGGQALSKETPASTGNESLR